MSLSTAPAPTPAPETIDWLARADALAEMLAGNAERHDADDSFVAENYNRLKSEGFFSAHVPVELGGGGADYAVIAAVIRRLGASCGSTALTYAMHSHLIAVAAWRWKHQNAPTDGLLKRVAAEDLVLVSTGGSDWLKGAGTAVKVDGGFRITARKAFSSGCLAGDLLMTSAVYDDPEAGATVLHFGVPFSAEGLTIHDTWRVMGMRGTGSHDVELKEVFLADAAVSGRRPQGKWHPLFHIISLLAFPLIYAAYVGVAEGARNRALEIARQRAPDEGLTMVTGEMENAFFAAEASHTRMIHLAQTAPPGGDSTSLVMTGRTLVGEAAIRTAELALEVAGGAAFHRGLGLERAFRDVQGARFHPLQRMPQRRYTGRVALGLDIDG